MPRTLSAPWLARLDDEEAGLFLELYEFTLPSGVKKWARGAVTWNSVAYTAYIAGRGTLIEEVGGAADSVTVDLINVDGVVRALIAASEFADAKFELYIAETTTSTRWLLFSGYCTNPTDVTSKRVTVQVNGLVDRLRRTPVPARIANATCPWMFKPVADPLGVSTPCAYTAAVATAGAGSGTTTLTPSSMTPFMNARHRTIKIGSGGTPVEITNRSATTLTLAAVRTWASNADIFFTTCRKTFTDCQESGQESQYGGFRGFRDVRDKIQAIKPRETLVTTWTRSGNYIIPGTALVRRMGNFEVGMKLRSAQEAVPIAYGRRLVKGVPVEFNHYSQTDAEGRAVDMIAAFYLLSAGPLRASPTPFLKTWVNGRKRKIKFRTGATHSWIVAGTFFRLGVDAVAGVETFEDYEADQEAIRPQNIDFRGSTGTSYNKLAYAIYTAPADADIWQRENDDGPYIIPELIALMDGRLVDRYDSGGAYVDTAVSSNPIWCAIDLLTDSLNGANFPIADIDLPTAYTAAAFADTLIVSVESDTTIKTASLAETHIHVESAAGYRVGDPIWIDGSDSGKTVAAVVSAQKIEVSAAMTTSIGQQVYTKIARFECNVAFSERESAYDKIVAIMNGCRGYFTTTQGKLRLFIEGTESKEGVPYFKDLDYTYKQFIVPGEDGLRLQKPDMESIVNEVEVEFVSEWHGEANEDKVTLRDEAHIAEHLKNSQTVNLPTVVRADGAVRIGKFALDRLRNEDPAAEIKVMLQGLKVAPGDIVQVKHSAIDLSGDMAYLRVVRTEIPDTLCPVTLRCVPFQTDWYTDEGEPSEPRNMPTLPLVVAAVDDSKLRRLEISWEISTSGQQVWYFEVYVAVAEAIDADEPEEEFLVKSRSHRRSYMHFVDEVDRGKEHRVRVVAVMKDGQHVVSDEVVAWEDSAGGPGDDTVEARNLVAHSDFETTDGWRIYPHDVAWGASEGPEKFLDTSFEHNDWGYINWNGSGSVATTTRVAPGRSGSGYCVLYSNTSASYTHCGRYWGAPGVWSYIEIEYGKYYMFRMWATHRGDSGVRFCARMVARKKTTTDFYTMQADGSWRTVAQAPWTNLWALLEAQNGWYQYEHRWLSNVPGAVAGDVIQCYVEVWKEQAPPNQTGPIDFTIDDISLKLAGEDSDEPDIFARQISLHMTVEGSNGPAAEPNRLLITDADSSVTRYNANMPTACRPIPNRIGVIDVGKRYFRKGGWVTVAVSVRYHGYSGAPDAMQGSIRVVFFNGPEVGDDSEDEFYTLMEIDNTTLKALYVEHAAEPGQHGWHRFAVHYQFPTGHPTRPTSPDPNGYHLLGIRSNVQANDGDGNGPFGATWEFDKLALYKGRQPLDRVVWLPQNHELNEGYDGDYDDNASCAVNYENPAQGGAATSTGTAGDVTETDD